jgi:hypothetical protein
MLGQIRHFAPYPSINCIHFLSPDVSSVKSQTESKDAGTAGVAWVVYRADVAGSVGEAVAEGVGDATVGGAVEEGVGDATVGLVVGRGGGVGRATRLGSSTACRRSAKVDSLASAVRVFSLFAVVWRRAKFFVAFAATASAPTSRAKGTKEGSVFCFLFTFAILAARRATKVGEEDEAEDDDDDDDDEEDIGGDDNDDDDDDEDDNNDDDDDDDGGGGGRGDVTDDADDREVEEEDNDDVDDDDDGDDNGDEDDGDDADDDDDDDGVDGDDNDDDSADGEDEDEERAGVDLSVLQASHLFGSNLVMRVHALQVQGVQLRTIGTSRAPAKLGAKKGRGRAGRAYENTDALPFLVPKKRILAFFPLFFACRQVKDKAYWNKEGVALELERYLFIERKCK